MTERIFYPYYTTVPRLWDLTVLEDQSNEWAVMALAEGSAYPAAILLLVTRMAEYDDRIMHIEQVISAYPQSSGGK